MITQHLVIQVLLFTAFSKLICAHSHINGDINSAINSSSKLGKIVIMLVGIVWMGKVLVKLAFFILYHLLSLVIKLIFNLLTSLLFSLPLKYLISGSIFTLILVAIPTLPSIIAWYRIESQKLLAATANTQPSSKSINFSHLFQPDPPAYSIPHQLDSSPLLSNSISTTTTTTISTSSQSTITTSKPNSNANPNPAQPSTNNFLQALSRIHLIIQSILVLYLRKKVVQPLRYILSPASPIATLIQHTTILYQIIYCQLLFYYQYTTTIISQQILSRFKTNPIRFLTNSISIKPKHQPNE
ncbi:hypothetical protein NEHOM01_0514 [Nematocida homosporus]|uniref:uncharacterized protein n=1 Tax=Nematocida homosporus TaxID=1912981 RepID=UPI002220D420|nr:uncharacterized protein NEHOM01_0514 [Nematocida homosporus]KAI5184963.1 hypothetical protein NEHOM01_0514 [Nematocida homosporus]